MSVAMREKIGIPPSDDPEMEAISREIVEWYSDIHAMPYDEYLQTDQWACMRQLMLQRAGFRCQVCNAADVLNVHHRTYERRGFERFEDLIVLCRGCHKLFHENRRLA